MAAEDVSFVHLTEEQQKSLEQPKLIHKLIIEFIGIFFLVLTICLTIGTVKGETTSGQPPLAIGGVLMVMIFMGGHISGAHYNPAVTLGVCLRGKMHWKEGIAYASIQIIGAILAAAVSYGLTDLSPAPRPGNRSNEGKALVAEILFTFALVSVVLNTATTKSQEDNSFFGLAIGFTVMAGAYACGSISGAQFNPAVATGLIFVDCVTETDGNPFGTPKYIWIYYAGPLFGAALAAGVFRITNPREFHMPRTRIEGNTTNRQYEPLQISS